MIGISLVAAAHLAAAPHPPAVRISRGEVAVFCKPASLEQTVRASLTKTPRHRWRLGKSGAQAEFQVQIQTSELLHGTVFCVCQLFRRSKSHRSLVGHWVVRGDDAASLTGNPYGDPRFGPHGIGGSLGAQIASALDSFYGGFSSIGELAGSVPSVSEKQLGLVRFWRPDMGGDIAPNEQMNLRFASGERFRLQIRPIQDTTIRVAVVDPSGKVVSAYSPEYPCLSKAGQWSRAPLDAALGFGSHPKSGTWHVVLLFEPSEDDHTESASSVWGGVSRGARKLPDTSNPDVARLGSVMSGAWTSDRLSAWRKVELTVKVRR
ncbi:MAG TPA: hypothetical protein VG944_23190 [Fimbriimonas sp.]|nr:hypothetical protein [Fimbriimonas sp.]